MIRQSLYRLWPRTGALFAAQPSVPHLPLPPIRDTLSRYIEHVEPLVRYDVDGETKLARTKNVVADFVASGEAERLQDTLRGIEARAGTDASYVGGFWDDMYLSIRDSQVWNTTPFLSLKRDERRRQMTVRAANLIAGSVDFARRIADNSLPQDTKPTPMDARQYTRLFSGARIPQAGRDDFRCYQGAEHVVVLCNGSPYVLNVEREQASEGAIRAALDRIVEHARGGGGGGSGGGVGVCTADLREHWASMRSSLCASSKQNRDAFEVIDTALFVVCLDLGDTADKARALLCGGDFDTQSQHNRWWDKQQVVVFEDGDAAMLLEHTAVDGATFLRWNEATAAFQQASEYDDDAPAAAAPAAAWAPIAFDYDRSHLTEIERSNDRLRKAARNMWFEVSTFEDFGTNVAKSASLSPDAVVQSAFQLAYFAATKRTDSTYESCNTKHFMAGRTETIRSVTKESVELQRRWRATRSAAARARLLRDAVAAHVARATAAKRGEGVDRHLWALYKASLQARQSVQDYEVPALFQDESFSRLLTSVVSTSQVSAPYYDTFGFGPVCPQGIGVAYNLGRDRLVVNVAAFRSGPKANRRVPRELRRALNEIKQALS